MEGQTLQPVGAPAPQHPALQASTAMAAAEQRDRAAIMVAAEMSVRYPRNEMVARDRALAACRSIVVAEHAEYSFPRGGQRITGPTVALVREVSRCWGNIRYGYEIVDSANGRLRIIGWAWDLDPSSNLYVQTADEFDLMVQRKDKQTGETRWVEADERDSRELLNKRAAICERNALKKLLPQYLIDEALAACSNTRQQGFVDKLKKDRAGTVAKLIRGWAKKNVTEAMLADYLGHKVETVTPDEMSELHAAWQSIEEGASQIDDHFKRVIDVKPSGTAEVPTVPTTPAAPAVPNLPPIPGNNDEVKF